MTVPLHSHDEAQLLFAASGTMQVYTATGRWLVPPQLAVWIPAGVEHWIDILSDTETWMLYWDFPTCREWAPSRSLDRAFALRVTSLLRELIFAAFAADAHSGKSELVVRLILHELTETPDAPTFLPLPTSVIGRRVADLRGSGDPVSRALPTNRTGPRAFPQARGTRHPASPIPAAAACRPRRSDGSWNTPDHRPRRRPQARSAASA